MVFEVAFIPPDAALDSNCVCVVIDVLRASSTIVTIFDKGCSEIHLTDNVTGFLDTGLAADTPGLLVCAEDVLGSCLKGADFSPSLEEIERFGDIGNRKILMQTTNGTVAIHALTRKGVTNIFIGCMLNAQAVMRRTISLADKLSSNILIICAGRDNGTSYTIDDVYCAARLLQHGIKITEELEIRMELQDSAKLAMMLLDIYPGAVEAFGASASGNTMRNINCQRDILLCARENISQTVPQVCGGTSSGQIVIKKQNDAGGAYVQDLNVERY